MINTDTVISEAIQKKIFNYAESYNLEPNLIELSSDVWSRLQAESYFYKVISIKGIILFMGKLVSILTEGEKIIRVGYME